MSARFVIVAAILFTSAALLSCSGPGTPSAELALPQDRQPAYPYEDYAEIQENTFRTVVDQPLSTFAIDVDAASYSNVRRYLNAGHLPPADAVRVEEMINYFVYDYPQPRDEHPFSVYAEVSDCPWNSGHKLVHIGLQGKRIPTDELPRANLVFLLDVSGSMQDENKLPLLKQAFKMLVSEMRPDDRVAIVTYAGDAGLALESTKAKDLNEILNAIDGLVARGSTHGSRGIELAYEIAEKHFIDDGNNRVILATDGDFNVGITSHRELNELIAEKREMGIYLTVLGFGIGNLQDARMEQLADHGNGNFAYIDNLLEAKKVLIEEFGGTLFTIAKDVKLQVEFNPVKVAEYRLVGYENRLLREEDFDDDEKDAGELGAGHTVTALYEIVPATDGEEDRKSSRFRYQQTKLSPRAWYSDEIMTVNLRYKLPDEDESQLIVEPIIDRHIDLAYTSDDFRFAAAVAQFGMILRGSEFVGDATLGSTYTMAGEARGRDREGYRAEFVRLVEMTELIAKGRAER